MPNKQASIDVTGLPERQDQHCFVGFLMTDFNPRITLHNFYLLIYYI